MGGYSWAQAWLEINGLVQNCSNSIANALELLQSCTKLSKRGLFYMHWANLLAMALCDRNDAGEHVAWMQDISLGHRGIWRNMVCENIKYILPKGP